MPNTKYYDWESSRGYDLEFLSNLAGRLKVSPKEAKKIQNAFVDSVREIIRVNYCLPIRKLGIFTLRQIRRSKFKNSSTGIMEVIPLITVVRFKPASSWRDEVNAELKEIVKKKLQEARIQRGETVNLE